MFVAIHVQELRRQVFFAGLHLQVPQTVTHALQRQFPARLALKQGLFGLLALGDVLHNGRALDHLPVGPLGITTRMHPDRPPLEGAHFNLEIMLCGLVGHVSV